MYPTKLANAIKKAEGYGAKFLDVTELPTDLTWADISNVREVWSVAKCAATHKGDPANLCGIAFRFEGETCTISATDSYMGIYETLWDSKFSNVHVEEPILFPAAPFLALSENQIEAMSISNNGQYLHLRVFVAKQRHYLYFTQINHEGLRVLDVKSMVGHNLYNDPRSIQVQVEEFLTYLNRVPVTAIHPRVILRVTDYGLELLSVEHEGDGDTIMLDADLLKKCLSAFSSKSVVSLSWHSPLRPLHVLQEGVDKYALLMPVRQSIAGLPKYETPIVPRHEIKVTAVF